MTASGRSTAAEHTAAEEAAGSRRTPTEGCQAARPKPSSPRPPAKQHQNPSFSAGLKCPNWQRDPRQPPQRGSGPRGSPPLAKDGGHKGAPSTGGPPPAGAPPENQYRRGSPDPGTGKAAGKAAGAARPGPETVRGRGSPEPGRALPEGAGDRGHPPRCPRAPRAPYRLLRLSRRRRGP